MELEAKQFNQVKKYLLNLGYPTESILYDYKIDTKKHIDLVVKVDEKFLVLIEVKSPNAINLNQVEEIGYNPIARKLQKEAQELGAKFYIISNGENHVWLQTGEGGRPEPTIEIQFGNFNLNTLSESKYTKEILNHVVEFLRNFPLSGDNLHDESLVFYIKLIEETSGKRFNRLDEIVDHFISKSLPIDILKSKNAFKIIKEALSRLESVEFRKNKISVLQFIDDSFKNGRGEWNIPRWLSDFLIKTAYFQQEDNIVDLIAKNGVLTSAAYLNNVPNITSYITNINDYFWLKIQQLLLIGKEEKTEFVQSTTYRYLNFIKESSYDGAILVPPFNLRIPSEYRFELSKIGSKDSTSIFFEAAINTVKSGGKVIAIVPDTFLTSSKNIHARHFFLSLGSFESIISLPAETFKPASVKTSLITFLKGIKTNHVFFASLDEVPKGSPLMVKDSLLLDSLIKNLIVFRNKASLNFSKNGFIAENLDPENFHFSKYWFELNHGNSKNLQLGFISVPLKELLLQIVRGDALVEDQGTGDIPYIAPASIRSMRLIKSELKYTSQVKTPKKISKVEVNDIVINTIGTYRGTAALVTSDFSGLPYNRHIISLTPNKGLVLPEYLVIALNSRFVKEQFYDSSTGVVIPSLNLKNLENIYIPVPNFDEQENIVLEYQNIIKEIYYTQAKAHRLEASLSEKLNSFGKEGGNK